MSSQHSKSSSFSGTEKEFAQFSTIELNSDKSHRSCDSSDLEDGPSNPHDIPNGGFVAWLQVLGAFFLWFNTWGLVNAYGSFGTYYELGPLHGYPASTIAWIGSIQAYLMLFTGALTGPLFDAGHFRLLLIVGSSLIVLGMATTSVSTKLWQIMLSQAFAVGIGQGCLFSPSLAVLSTYFSEKRFFIAMGLAAAGSGLGGTIYPIVFHTLEPKLGFAATTRVIAYIAAGTLLISNMVIRVRTLPTQRRQIFDMAAWKEPAFTVYVIGSMIAFLGTWTPFVYIEVYALEYGITSKQLAFYLLPIITAGSIFGRVGPNLIAARIGLFNVVIPCVTITGVLAFCFIVAKTQESLIAVSCLYGFFSGSIVSIIPALGVSISPSRAVIGTRIGMACATIGLGMLAGTPVSGAILSHHGFTATWAFSGTVALLGACFLTAARVLHGGWILRQKL
ncbi:MFS general substrate transporter [Aureobasidium pullulans]|nr:MFS general substrate transporter [Aureobasidium pullulans]THX69555.1 MFS general substrate transporter [Aureobasidium pullulans]